MNRLISTGDRHILAYAKGDERYVWAWDEHQTDEVLRSLGRFATNPELDFTWYDAAILSQRIRQLKGAADA